MAVLENITSPTVNQQISRQTCFHSVQRQEKLSTAQSLHCVDNFKIYDQ